MNIRPLHDRVIIRRMEEEKEKKEKNKMEKKNLMRIGLNKRGNHTVIQQAIRLSYL